MFAALFGRGIIRISQVVTFLLLARMLSPAEFGWFGIITTAVTVAGLVGSLGLRAAFGYEVGQKHRTLGEAAGTSLVLWLPLGLISALAVYALYGTRLPIAALNSFAVITISVVASLLIILMQGIFLGRGDIRAFAMSETAPRVVLTALTVILVFTAGISLSTSLWAYCASFAIAAPVILWLALKGSRPLAVSYRGLGRTLRYGIITAVNLVLVTVCARLSMFVIERYRGPAEAGQFYAAVRVNEIVLEVATVVGVVLFSNAARQDENVSVLHRNARISCWIFWLFMAIAAFVALTAPVLIRTLAGSDYTAAGPVLQILALCLAPTAASKVIYQTLSGSGNARFGTPVIIASLVINTLIALALVPSLGIYGGAIALVVGQCLLYLGYVFSCSRRYNIPARDLLVPRAHDVRKITQSIVARFPRRRRS